MGKNETLHKKQPFSRMKETSWCSKEPDFRYVYAIQYLEKRTFVTYRKIMCVKFVFVCLGAGSLSV